MKFIKSITLICLVTLLSIASIGCQNTNTATQQTGRAVARQQSQYAKGQPIPTYNWSLERDLLIKLYNVRNQKVATHSVWRSSHGMVEGDCPSLGYGLPYDTSLTNPLRSTSISSERSWRHDSLTTIEQPEPNGIFASKNTAATWVLCLSDDGGLEPVYVEALVTVYPGSVKVNYETNRVIRYGASTVDMKQ